MLGRSWFMHLLGAKIDQRVSGTAASVHRAVSIALVFIICLAMMISRIQCWFLGLE